MEKTIDASVEELGRDTPSSPVPPPRKRSVIEKLGVYNVWVLILGTIVIFAALGFLAWVWAIAGQSYKTTGNGLPPLWRSMVARNWTSRVVTLVTVAVRVALAAQLCVFAALIAAVILERVGASNEDFPLLSMIRCANTGPQALLWNVMHTIGKGTQFRYTFLIIITICNALTLQFMSTFLLADFWDSRVVLNPRSLDDFYWAIADNQNATTLTNDYWSTGQISFPSFAEWRQSNHSKGANFSDTGKVYRGILPFTNATLRENLRSYKGPMVVADERVVCVKPTVTNATFWSGSGDTIEPSIYGTLAFDNLHPDVFEGDNPEWLDFNCPVSYEYTQQAWWQISMCQLGIGVGVLKNGINPEYKDYGGYAFDSTKAWIIFNTTYENHYELPQEGFAPLAELTMEDGPWARYGQDQNFTIQLSLCLANPKPDTYDVHAQRTDDVYGENYETEFWWNKTDHTYDTFPLRQQLGLVSIDEMIEVLGYQNWAASFSSKEQLEEHLRSNSLNGVLSFDPSTNWPAARKITTQNVTDFQALLDRSQYRKGIEQDGGEGFYNQTFIFTPWTSDEHAMHRSLLWLAQDIMRSTKDPVLMLQGLEHALLHIAYYDLYNNFDISSTELHSEVEIRYIPASWFYFMIVSILLGLHLILMLVALIWFLTRTELSLLGNAWQAVAQVVSDDTRNALHHGAMATDDELRKNAELAQRIKLGKSQNNGRLEAVTVRQ